MHFTARFHWRLVALLVALLGAATLALPSWAADLTADEVLDRYIEATGGRDAHLALTSMRQEGELELRSGDQRVVGVVAILAKAPNLQLVARKLPNEAPAFQGYDGKTGWLQEPGKKVRDLTVLELEQVKLFATLNHLAEYKTHFPKRELISSEQFDQRKAYRVKLTPKSTHPLTLWIDAETFLLIGNSTTIETAEGSRDVATRFRDYREVGNLKFPFVRVQQIGPLVVTYRLARVTLDLPLEKSLFARPAKPLTEIPKIIAD